MPGLLAQTRHAMPADSASLQVFYNGQRRHSALGYLSPVAFEQH